MEQRSCSSRPRISGQNVARGSSRVRVGSCSGGLTRAHRCGEGSRSRAPTRGAGRRQQAPGALGALLALCPLDARGTGRGGEDARVPVLPAHLVSRRLILEHLLDHASAHGRGDALGLHDDCVSNASFHESESSARAPASAGTSTPWRRWPRRQRRCSCRWGRNPCLHSFSSPMGAAQLRTNVAPVHDLPEARDHVSRPAQGGAAGDRVKSKFGVVVQAEAAKKLRVSPSTLGEIAWVAAGRQVRFRPERSSTTSNGPCGSREDQDLPLDRGAERSSFLGRLALPPGCRGRTRSRRLAPRQVGRCRGRTRNGPRVG
jgi:hypothetical protein